VAKTVYNHKSRIKSSQPAKIKAIYPGMFIGFKYRKAKVFDDSPILLVLYRDYVKEIVHGLNLNYLSVYQMKVLIDRIIKGSAAAGGMNIFKTEDQTEDYDDALPYRNLLKKPYTRLKLPVFKEKREGNPVSKSESAYRAKILYEKVIKRVMNQKTFDIYRTYHVNLMSNTKVFEFDFFR
jgi:hypothetical protein